MEKNVAKMPISIITVKNKADSKEEAMFVLVPTKNIVSIAIRVGKRPLHGTKLFVRIASSRSRFESIILHPTTPAALQPNPIHIVSACLP